MRDSAKTMKNNRVCQSCKRSKLYHFLTWTEGLQRLLLPPLEYSQGVAKFANLFLEKIFTILRLARYETDMKASDIQLRSFVFIEEMKKRGATCWALRSFAGFTNHIKVKINGKTSRFETLPVLQPKSKYCARIADYKKLTKLHCKAGHFPVAEGRSFW